MSTVRAGYVLWRALAVIIIIYDYSSSKVGCIHACTIHMYRNTYFAFHCALACFHQLNCTYLVYIGVDYHACTKLRLFLIKTTELDTNNNV